jgi:hypothetical protein
MFELGKQHLFAVWFWSIHSFYKTIFFKVLLAHFRVVGELELGFVNRSCPSCKKFLVCDGGTE